MVTKYILFLMALSLAACTVTPETGMHSNAISSASLSAQPLKLQSIPLELTTHLGDQLQFVEGEELQLLLSLGSNAYVYMYHIDAVGNITQMLPHKNQSSHYYLAAYFLTVPEYVDGFRFVINKPFGSETIWVIASDEHIEMNASADSIDDIRQKIKQASNQAYGEYSITIITNER